MLSEDKYFRDLTEAELWQRYCGFLDLSIDEFMDIQKELLMDQIDMVAGSPLGKKIMGNRKPRSIEEFRRTVPLTMYEDYEPYLSDQREDVLAVKPQMWCHSAGRAGHFKWIPHSSEIVKKGVRSYLAAFILSSCDRKGEINIAPGFRVLTVLPPPPYTTGSIIRAISQHISVRIFPPMETGTMDFQERTRIGFKMALKEGVDIIGSIVGVLVKMGEQFERESRRTHFSLNMLHPKILFRLLSGQLRRRKEKRTLLPKDLWPTKGIVSGGLDIDIFKDDVVHYWGNQPFEIYGGTEALVYAMQSWNRTGLTFLPDMAFLEFIPHEELLQHADEKEYQPSTVLFDELEEGKSYEVVITHLYGMPLLRYRMNDLIKVVAMKDEEAGINLPQIAFRRRTSEVINLANLAQLDEKTILRAIVSSGINFNDWTASKEYDNNLSFLQLYLELNEESESDEVARVVDEQLSAVDVDYNDIKGYLDYKPIKITLLSPGTFQAYMTEKRKEGADLAQLKPPHMNPSKPVIKRLLQLSESISTNDESSF